VDSIIQDVKWLGFEGSVKPGDAGNPTSRLMTHMKIIDNGACELSERKENIIHMVLEGKKLNGHYILQKIAGAKDKKWMFRKASEETLTASFPCETSSIEGMHIAGVAMKAGPYVLTNGETVEIAEEHLKKIADLLPNSIIDCAHNDPRILATFGFDQPQDFGRVARAWVNVEKKCVVFDGEITNPAAESLYAQGKIAGHSIDLDLLRGLDRKVLNWFRVKALTSVPKPMKPQSEDGDKFKVTDA
jgi:hypothetical protein